MPENSDHRILEMMGPVQMATTDSSQRHQSLQTYEFDRVFDSASTQQVNVWGTFV